MVSIGFLLFSSAIALAFFLCSIALIALGRYLGAMHLAREGKSAMAGLSAVESAVFALMGLILAFTLSGALQRFDERRELIMKEANAISTAWDRTALLETAARDQLRPYLKSYFAARIELYRLPISFSWETGAAVYSQAQLDKIASMKGVLWDKALSVCTGAKADPNCQYVLPALNTAFEVARERAGANERHPPQILYVMLFVLGLGGSMLAGFGMAASKTRSLLHITIFAAAFSMALFVMTELEFPRLGLFRVDSFDHFLTAVLDQMV